MTSEVMEAVLTRFNRKLIFEDGKVILFLNNTMSSRIYDLSVFVDQNHFLPKNKISRPQPLDAGIIQNLKTKYQKRLVKYGVARI